MSTMVERLALVLSEKGYEIDEDMFHYTPEERPHSYNALVRAILEAMMEPTEEMLNAPYEAEIDFGPGGSGDIEASPDNVWRAMIQAALKESE